MKTQDVVLVCFFIIKLNINSLILEWFADFKTSLLNPLMMTFVHIWCLKYLVQREQRHLPRTTPTNPKNLLPEITNPKNGFDSIHPLRSFVPGSQNCCHSPTSAPAKSIEGSTFQLSSNDVTQNGGSSRGFWDLPIRLLISWLVDYSLVHLVKTQLSRLMLHLLPFIPLEASTRGLLHWEKLIASQ